MNSFFLIFLQYFLCFTLHPCACKEFSSLFSTKQFFFLRDFLGTFFMDFFRDFWGIRGTGSKQGALFITTC